MNSGKNPLMRLLLPALLLAAAGPPDTAQSNSGGELYLANATIVDPASGKAHSGNILIRDGIIVSTPSRPPKGFSGSQLDLAGKWLIPGLVDLHVHTFGNVDASGVPSDAPGTEIVARRELFAGVTSLLDLFGDEDALYAARQRQRSGQVPGADIFASLSALTVPGGHGTEFGVKPRFGTSPAEAESTIADWAKRKPDVIKIIYDAGLDKPHLSKATLFAAVRAAKEHGLKTVVHIVTMEGFRDAVEAGPTAVTHLPDVPVPRELAELMARKHIASIPTLTAHMDFPDFMDRHELLGSPLASAATTPALIQSYWSAKPDDWLRAYRKEEEDHRADRFASMRTLARAGVTILTGTDAGALGTLHGYSLHRELMLFVEAGLSPREALAGATTKAGAFLGQKYCVKRGCVANLLVLDASPLADIANTQRIALVIQHGEVVDRAHLLTGD